TPTTAGTSTFTVRAVYGSASDEKQFTLTINSPVETLRITTTSLPDGMTNSPYSTTLTASITGVTWSVSSGNLPAGLSLSSSTGVISGTPTTAGTSTFTVKAVSGSQSAEKSLSITVTQSITGIGSSSGGCESFMGIAGLILLAYFLKKR
ncbi:MAG: putative Ig domain-containing protein, partial [Synergistaceae bacterium]|nr:putative Ig domain-containing protein [Synergistaceae bacterium]